VSDIQHDTLQLAKALIACRSITPADDGALAMVATRLSAAGFQCERLDRGSVSNLWARYGDAGPLVCLAGMSTWSHPARLGSGRAIRSRQPSVMASSMAAAPRHEGLSRRDGDCCGTRGARRWRRFDRHPADL
jgi:hypothetical protein